MPKSIGTGALTVIDTHDMAVLTTQVSASGALQQLYADGVYSPDRVSTPLVITVDVYKAASGSPIQIPASSLKNINWGSTAGGTDLNSGVSGVTAFSTQLTISSNSFVPASQGGRAVYFSAEYEDPYAGITQQISVDINLLLSVKGNNGAIGGSVDVTSDRALVFAFSDGVSTTPTDITLTAVTSNIGSKTFEWYLDGVKQIETVQYFVLSLTRFGSLTKSRQVTVKVTSGTDVFQSSVTVLRTDTYSVEAGATKGATIGQNFVDDNGQVISDLALLNKYSNGSQLAGDFSGNPFLVRVDADYDRPANVKAAWGVSDPLSIAFADSTRSSLLLTGGAADKGAGWPAFRTQYGMKYRIVLRWRLLDFASGGIGVSFTTICKDSEIAPACTHLGLSPSEAGVDVTATYNNLSYTKVIADTSGIVTLGTSMTNKAVTETSPSSWFSTTLEFTPSSTVVWASFIASLSGAVGANAKFEIDTCYIYSITGTIYANQIAPGIITQLSLADAAVTAAKTSIAAIDAATGNLSANTVAASQIVSNAITSAKIAAGAVDSTKTSIAAINSATGDLNANAVATYQLAASAVTSGKIATGAVNASRTAIAAINSATGNLNANTVAASQLASNAVTSVKIAAGAVDATKTTIAAINSTTGNLNAGTVDAAQLVANAITATKIAAGAVDSTKTAIAAINALTGNLNIGTVNTSNLVAGAVDNKILAANSVDSAKILAGAVTSAAIAANAVTTSKMSVRKHFIY